MSTSPTHRIRKGHGGTAGALKDAVRTMPQHPSQELYGETHAPHWRDYRPLLRPDGPFYGSGG